MAETLQALATRVLGILALAPRDEMGNSGIDGDSLAKVSGLEPSKINDAVTLLVHSGYAEWIQTLGTAPYIFLEVSITPIGRFEYEKTQDIIGSGLNVKAPDQSAPSQPQAISLPPTPIGSPYGFKDEDWEYITERKDDSDRVTVVLGYQFASDFYDSDALQENIRDMFQNAVEKFNSRPAAIPLTLDFRPLAAGYGEHLFNEIARDIIAADIAVFDTSDLNSNVMIELGVALTWGVRVLPIKRHDRPKPPSDISGHTWADYDDSAARFLDPTHDEKMIRMVERAVRKKGRRNA